MIQLRGLQVLKSGLKILSLERAEIERGSRCLIRGRNGAGKSTLLRILGGLERLNAGEIQGLPSRHARVLVHQAPFVFRGTVRENVALGLKSRPLSRSEREQRLDAILNEFSLSELSLRPASSLSGGERRRLALARALVLEPELLLLDEPLSDLDSAGREALEAAICARSSLTVVTASPVNMPEYLSREVIDLGPQSERIEEA